MTLMNGDASFRQVLKQKMEEEIPLSPSPAEAPRAFHSPLSAELLTLRFSPLKKRTKGFYSSTDLGKKVEPHTAKGPKTAPTTPQPEPSWHRETLNPEEQKALLTLEFEADKVTLSGIKRAWRRQALRLHPDRQRGKKNSGPQFQQAQEAYQKLCAGLKRLAQEESLR